MQKQFTRFTQNANVLVLFSLISTTAWSLFEANGSALQIAKLLGVSLAATFSGLAIYFGLMLTQKSSKTNWLILTAGALAAGAAKGYFTWLLLGEGPEQFTMRLIVSAMSWAAFIPALHFITNSMVALTLENKSLRLLVAKSRDSSQKLEQEYEWLAKIRIEGLNERLAKDFVNLLSELNKQGSAPDGLARLANELRKAAKTHVRSTSSEVWKERSTARFRDLLSNLLTSQVHLGFALSMSLLTGLVSSLRTFGVSGEIWMMAAPSFIFVAALYVTRRRAALQHLAAPISGALAGLFLTALGATTTQAWLFGFSIWIWNQGIAIASAGWTASMAMLQSERRALKTQAHGASQKIDSLVKQLDELDLEIAKHLHAVVQGRLMAYAIKLERPGSLTNIDRQELVSLLRAPMHGFAETKQGLHNGLADLVLNWETVIEVQITESFIAEGPVASTLQIIREAISNAVRHGLADSVTISIVDTNSSRQVTVIDNGIGPRTGKPGLGTQILNQLCQTHSLSRSPAGGSVFQAQLTL